MYLHDFVHCATATRLADKSMCIYLFKLHLNKGNFTQKSLGCVKSRRVGKKNKAIRYMHLYAAYQNLNVTNAHLCLTS